MERYTELKTKIVASIAGDEIKDKNEATLSQSISEFNDILNASDNGVSSARSDLGILIPLFNKFVLSTNIRIRQASVPVFAKLESILTENLQLKKSDWWKEYKNSFEENCQKLVVLKDKGCAEWPAIWSTMTRLLGDELHSSVTLTNALCKIVEKAFKNKTENRDEEIQNGYHCWKVIVDGFTMSKVPVKKNRAAFLLMPYKSPSIPQSKSICEVKLESWLHTLSKLSASDESFIDIVLPPLIDYMFTGNKAAIKFISANRCADEFIGLLKTPNIFKRQAELLTSSTAICMETIKDNKQLSQIVWMTALDAIKKHIESIGVDDPKTDVLLAELVSVINKLESNLPSAEFVDLLMMCLQGKYKLLPLKSKFQMLIDITMKPKNLSQLQSPKVYNVIQALLRLFMPKERTEKIFSVALDALQVAAADTENNDQKTNMVSVLGEAWRAIVNALIESIQWIDLSAQFICPFILFPLVKNILKCDSKTSISFWKNLLSACMKTSDSNNKNIINELIVHFASLDTESYSSSLEAMNMISDMCESFDAIPYYSGVIDGLLKKSNSDSLNPIIQSLFESMLKYANKKNKEACKLLEIANKLSNSKHDVAGSTVRKNLSKFLNCMAMIENTTPEKSSKFLHRLAKAKEMQSQNNNRSPSSSPVGLFHLNSVEKKSSPLSKSSPLVKTARKTIDEESSQDFVMVPPKPKKVVLTNHQKEKLSTRRCDIPALYQDLSQDTMSMDSILNAGAVNGQDKTILIKKNQLNIKDEAIQSICEDAVGFDCAKPAVEEEIVIKQNDEKEDEEIIENTQVVDLTENKSSCQPIGEHQDDTTKRDTSTTENSNDVVPENQCKESKENVSDTPIKNTDEVNHQKSDDITSEAVSKVKSQIKTVEESCAVVQSEHTTVLPSIEKMETEGSVTAVSKLDIDVEKSDEKQDILNNTVSDPASVKDNTKTRKSATPLRKSVRKSKSRISPNKVNLLGKRRSLSTTGINGSDVSKSPVTSKKTKLQSRKSIAVVQSHSDAVKKDVEEPSDNVETSEPKESLANGGGSKIVEEESCDTKGTSSASKIESNEEDPMAVESSNAASSQGGRSVSKQRKRALESTTSEASNFKEKSPTLKKRLRKSIGPVNNSNSPGIGSKRITTKKSKSKLDSQSVQVEEKTEVDASKSGYHSTENSGMEVSEVALSTNQDKIDELENSAVQADQTKSIVVLEKLKNDLITNSENRSDENDSTSQSNAIEDKSTRKVSNKSTSSTDTTPKSQRLTPRINSKKKSPCDCCKEESYVSSRVKRKESIPRTLFEQSTPSRKKGKNTKQSTDKIAEKEFNSSVLSELDCLQASSGNNTVLPPKKNELLQSVGTDKKPEIGSPTLNDSVIIDIHISDKEKMELENCVLISENGDGKENQELSHVSKKVITDESDSVEVVPDLKATSSSDIISPAIPVTEDNEEIHIKDEAVKENISSVNKNLDEENGLKSSTEVQKSKNKHKGLDSWVIRSPRVDRNKDSHNESVTEENPELNESNLSNHTEVQGVSGVSDSDESFIVSSQQPTDSIIKIKRQSNSFAKKQVTEEAAPSCKENDVFEKCIASEEISKQIVETESAKETETEKKSESFSKSHVCRRLLDNLESNKVEDETSEENQQQSENDPDLSLINDNVYCQVLSQEVEDMNNQISTKEATDVISHISTDHDYVSPIRNQNGKTDKASSMNSNGEATSISVDVCQSSIKSTGKTTVPDEQIAANKSSNVIDDLSNKKNDTGSSTSKNNFKDENTSKLSSPDRSKILLSPSRATRIKMMALESTKESSKKNEVCDPPETKIKEELGNNFSSPEREMNKDEFSKVVSPPTAFKNKQSVSPEQSSSSKQRSTSVCPPSPSRALKIKRLIQNKSSTEETPPACSSPKKASLPSPSKASIESILSSPPRTSRFEKPLGDSSMRSPEKSVSFDVQEKNGIEVNCSVASSPQSARGRTAQLMGLVNGDSPAQFRRHQQTPKRIRPVRIITASDTETHEGADWVCKTYSPSAVPSPSILKTRLRTDDVSPQSSPSVTRTKLSDDPSEISPPAKKKRVNFHDPPLTQKLFFFKTGSGKVVSQGKCSEPDPKSSVQETVPDVGAIPVEPAEPSSNSSNVISNKNTLSDSIVNADSNLPSSSASLKTLWNDVDEKEKLGFISHTMFENKELFGIALENVSCDSRKLLVDIMCNDPEFVSLISKENSVARCVRQDIESLSDNICKLNEESQLKLMKNVDESVKIKLLGDISPEMRVSLLSDDVCTNPKLLKNVLNKVKVEDVAEEIASRLGTSSELGKKILDKAGVDNVADLLISGINILKMKR